MPSLIHRIATRIADGRPNDHPEEWLQGQPPVMPEAVAAAESQLAFRLSDLLRRLYIEVGNGGFGPGFGLIPLSAESLGQNPPPEAEFDLLGDYRRLVHRYVGKPGGGWPAGLVPVFYFGCGVFELVDCGDAAGPVVGFDPDSDDLATLVRREWSAAPSLERRLEAWLGDEPATWW
jgi:hypothetical protein